MKSTKKCILYLETQKRIDFFEVFKLCKVEKFHFTINPSISHYYSKKTTSSYTINTFLFSIHIKNNSVKLRITKNHKLYKNQILINQLKNMVDLALKVSQYTSLKNLLLKPINAIQLQFVKQIDYYDQSQSCLD